MEWRPEYRLRDLDLVIIADERPKALLESPQNISTSTESGTSGTFQERHSVDVVL